MVNHAIPIWFDKAFFPEELESVRYTIHPELGKEPIFHIPQEYIDQALPYITPDDPMDYAFGVTAVILVVGGIAYFGTPIAAGIFIAEPFTITATFFAGVALSNWLQMQF